MSDSISIVKLYGAPWCGDCKRSRAFLDSKKIAYDYIDIDAVPGAADEVSKINHGLKSIPTIIFSDGSVLVEPSNQVLGDKLGVEA